VDGGATKADLKWLAYRLAALGLDGLNRAAAVPGLNREDAYRKTLLIPPLPEQRRIGAILDKAEALCIKRRASLRVLSSLPQVLFLEMFGDPQTNPKGWTLTSLRDLCSAVIDCPHSTPIYSQERTPFACVRSSDIQDGELILDEAKYVGQKEYEKRVSRGTPKTGDVIYCREGARFGNAARVGESAVCLGQRMMLLRPNPAKATTAFVWGFLTQPSTYREVSRLVGGSASPHLNVRDVVALRTPLPPLTAQENFAQCLLRVDASKACQHRSLVGTESLWAALQQRAFSGAL
jgi:type I restriction enzyme S subunit